MTACNVNDFILEQLIRFDKADTMKEKVEVLSKLKSVVSSMEMMELENKLFYPVMPKVYGVFHALLDSTKVSDAGSVPVSTEPIAQNIQMACTVLGTLVSWIKSIDSAITLNSIYSLPVKALDILARAYRHCEESIEIYGSLVEQLSGPLGLFFKTTVCLQKEIMCLLEQIKVPNATAEDLKLLCDICYEIQALCKLVSCHDLIIAHGLWRTFARFVCRFSESLNGVLHIGSAVLYLSQFVIRCINHLKECFTSSEQQDFESKVKLTAFRLRSIITICATFEEEFCASGLISLILELYDLSVICCSTSILSEEQNYFVQNNLIVGIQPLIQRLLVHQAFLSKVETSSLVDYPHLKVPLCLLKTQVLVKMHSISDAFEHNEHAASCLNIFSSLLSLLLSCQTELDFSVKLVGITCAGKPKRMVSLHEYMVTRLGAFIAQSCVCHFSQLEVKMVRMLFCKNDALAMLICDIWCFLARYGPANLCYSHCCALARLLKLANNSDSQMWAMFLLQRLVNLLTTDQKAQFKMENPGLRPEIFDGRRTIAIKHPLNMFSLLDEESASGNILNKISTYKQLLALDSLMGKQQANVEVMHALQLKLTVCLLKLSIFLLPVSEEQQLLTAVLFAYSLSKCGSSTVQLILISFLKPFARQYAETCKEHGKLYHLFTLLFDELLSHKNAVFQYETLRVSSEFAYGTIHRNLVRDCIRKLNLKATVNNFFKKIPRLGPLSWQDVVKILDFQERWFRMTPSLQNDCKDASLFCIFDKKAELSALDVNVSELELCLDALALNADKLKNYQCLPVWAIAKIKSIVQTLNNVNSENSIYACK